MLIGCVLPISLQAETTNDPKEQAEAFFQKYIEAEIAFDASIADYYDNSAYIKNTRFYPNGQTRELVIPVQEYKELIRKVMPLAQLKGDTNSYSDISYTIEGDKVRIICTRYSNLKKYSSPFELLVGSNNNGEWMIFEEISESQP